MALAKSAKLHQIKRTKHSVRSSAARTSSRIRSEPATPSIVGSFTPRAVRPWSVMPGAPCVGKLADTIGGTLSQPWSCFSRTIIGPRTSSNPAPYRCRLYLHPHQDAIEICERYFFVANQQYFAIKMHRIANQLLGPHARKPACPMASASSRSCWGGVRGMKRLAGKIHERR